MRGGLSARWVRAALLLMLALGSVLALAPAPRAHADETRAANGQRAHGLDSAVERGDEEDDVRAPAPRGLGGLGGLLGGHSSLISTGLMAAAFYFFFMRRQGGGGQGGSGWGSYYLFWIVAPALLAVASSHPSALLLVVVGLVARKWLPDPYLALKYRARIRSLGVEVRANPGNVTARRDLAKIWIEKRRPQRALPLIEEALLVDTESLELLYFRGEAQRLLKQGEPALASFLGVIHQNPTFRYGEAYLGAADALILLGRHEDAEEALGHYLKINSSSLEALCKLARVRKARKDDAGAARARAEAQDVWHVLHGFQRRKQLGWYLRARLGR